MKTQQLLLIPALIFALFCVSATNGNEPSKSEPKAEVALQCGVTNTQIVAYLQNCSHHHTITGDIVDIPGTCSSRVPIENCKTATVCVSDGIITHSDGNAICSE
jgi:hypothetical protein